MFVTAFEYLNRASNPFEMYYCSSENENEPHSFIWFLEKLFGRTWRNVCLPLSEKDISTQLLLRNMPA